MDFYLYDYSEDKIYDSEIELMSDYVMVIEEFDEGILTLGLWDGGLSTLDLSDMSVTNEEFLDNRIYCITETNDGTIWVGTGAAAVFLQRTKRVINIILMEIDSGSGLSHPIVYSLYQDDSDILWVGTNGGGISKINPRKHNYLKYYHDAENEASLSSGKINKIFQDSSRTSNG